MSKSEINLYPEMSDDEMKKELFNHNMSILRNNIYEYILNNNLNENFFNFQPFFSNYCKDTRYVDQIVNELENNRWIIKKIYGGTAILICKTAKDLEKSIWNSTI